MPAIPLPRPDGSSVGGSLPGKAGRVVCDPAPLWPRRLVPEAGLVRGSHLLAGHRGDELPRSHPGGKMLPTRVLHIGQIFSRAFQERDNSQKSGYKKEEREAKEGAGGMPASETMGEGRTLQTCGAFQTGLNPPLPQAWLSPCWGNFFSLPHLPCLPEPGFASTQPPPGKSPTQRVLTGEQTEVRRREVSSERLGLCDDSNS